MKTFRKLAVSYVHNCVAHRLLFIADVLEALGYKSEASKLDAFHDWSAKFYK